LRWRGLLSVEAHIERQAARVPDVDWPTSLRLVAIDADTGERVLLDPLSGARLAEGVAAARAVPGLVEPVPVAGRRLIDGALGSATNIDLLAHCPVIAVVVTATPSDARPGTLEAFWNDALAAECADLAARGTRVAVVHASAAAIEAMGDDVMSPAGAPRAVVAGREQGAKLARRLVARAAF
jgi:NTE family protein